MTNERSEDLLEEYLQSDAPARAAQFDAFLAGLKALASRGEAACASAWACRAISPALDYSAHLRLHKIISRMPPGQGLGKLKLAILGGPTTTQLCWLLQNFLWSQGIDAEIFEGDYGLFRQSVLLPDARLDAFRPQIVFFATGCRDLPEGPAPSMAEADFREWVAAEADQWRQLWHLAHERWNALIIQNLFETPPWGVYGHYVHQVRVSRERALRELNEALLANAPAHVVFHDLQMLVLEEGARQWFDPRFYLEAKMPCGPECMPVYAHSVASRVLAARGKSKKVLVLDLDNTLWGGVVGDDGIGGIRIGQGSAEGESFLAFQKYAKALSTRGVLLAVCSKNDLKNAVEPFEKIAEMPLRLADFSSFRANWDNKADNLRAMAEELGLGLDSFVFVDDNPAERALVRRFLPQVAVPDLPSDPADYVQALARHRFFETVALTEEDAKRSEFYRQNRQRKQLAAAHADVESFLRSLDMQARVEPIGPANIERSTQLINKSNQFNLTTRRYTLAEIKEKAEAENWATFTISLRDAMGDNGLISVLLARQEGADLAIDTWVMSCRVLQRGVERLAAEILIGEARKRGCRRLTGCYIPTPKNQMVSGLYETLGFAMERADEDGSVHWARTIGQESTARAHCIRVTQ